ncbi:MAG: flagellar assembly protein FliH [Pelosinus sp.]|nr:flagellar assembly protein FliH [Pelosinus sp.]
MPSIYKCVAVRQDPIVIKHEIRLAAVCKESNTDIPEPELAIDEQALRKAIRLELLNEVKCETEVLLASAKAEAEKCLSEANSQVELIKQQACDEGKTEGYQAGVTAGKADIRAEMQQELNKMVETANALVTNAGQEAEKMIIAAERQIIDIALGVARKLLAREIEENPAVILPIVKTALEKVHDQEQIVIRVSVDDFELVTEAKSDLQIMTGCEQPLTVLADQTLTCGNCVIDTAYGSVDARIDMQFDAIQKALQEVMP